MLRLANKQKQKTGIDFVGVDNLNLKSVLDGWSE